MASPTQFPETRPPCPASPPGDHSPSTSPGAPGQGAGQKLWAKGGAELTEQQPRGARLSSPILRERPRKPPGDPDWGLRSQTLGAAPGLPTWRKARPSSRSGPCPQHCAEAVERDRSRSSSAQSPPKSLSLLQRTKQDPSRPHRVPPPLPPAPSLPPGICTCWSVFPICAHVFFKVWLKSHLTKGQSWAPQHSPPPLHACQLLPRSTHHSQGPAFGWETPDRLCLPGTGTHTVGTCLTRLLLPRPPETGPGAQQVLPSMQAGG